ncbi:ribonuclease P subunit P29 [Methanobrevibacter ruminantium M1]|uniref:Ribonuclease P protein component 1 n=1 Tax=Methanobrevibacter ruminantium (strain ATCC 35063 / DSM 1093 / JCM 13430 / OCM 146 / M1) TaxID=634498 RepID=D3E2F0_METRM|nr:ribonuclease P protein component 1 [Methanobrevibacter ruminantium]ADC46711.1 ribonuclease P subunit P29 [Methanobrevibacter ruminantium M1]
MISSNNIFYHELIGLELKVVDSSNPSLIGLCGTVIDETKKTLLIEVEEKVLSDDLGSNQQNHFNLIYKEKLIQKDVSVFQFKVPDGTIVEIDGKILLNRPEDRIKKRYKKI